MGEFEVELPYLNDLRLPLKYGVRRLVRLGSQKRSYNRRDIVKR
jgi:hypothetical protein